MGKRFLLWLALLPVVLSLQHCRPHWQETYETDGENPYDLYVLHQLLAARSPGLTDITDSLSVLRSDTAGANYLFVGKYAYYPERAVTDLLDFVERGNTAFIAAYELPAELAVHLYGEDCYSPFSDQFIDPDLLEDAYVQRDTTLLRLEGVDSTFRLVQRYNFEPSPRTTFYVPETFLCDPELDNEVLGIIEGGYANFLRLRWGKGNFYLHTNPIVFGNYFLVDTAEYAYAESVLEVLDRGAIYWDEVSRVPPAVARQRSAQRGQRGYSGGRNLLTGNEALSYVQEQPALALAWYTLVLAALLYVIFRGKRRQRIIPVQVPRENSSKRFIDTISRLVLQKGNHGALARQELNSLRYFLHNRHGLRWKEGEPPPENLAELIGAPAAVVNKAVVEIRIVQKKAYLEEHELLRFYRAIEPLYGR